MAATSIEQPQGGTGAGEPAPVGHAGDAGRHRGAHRLVGERLVGRAGRGGARPGLDRPGCRGARGARRRGATAPPPPPSRSRWSTLVVAVLVLASLAVVQPGQTRVVQFFGRYVGTVRRTGLVLLAPLTARRHVSVRVNNFESARLKVNDADGNPVDIAAIVVWQVADTAKSVFAVENYLAFIQVQAEAALRHVAGNHPLRHRGRRAPRCAVPPTSWPTSSPSRWPPGPRWPASRWSRCGSATSPTRPRSPRRCCSASRPRPSWRPASGSSTARSAWSRWRWTG